MKKVSIYFLQDPRLNLRAGYVGQSSDPARRFRQHLSGRDPATANWILDLRAKGLEPNLTIVCESTHGGRDERITIRDFESKGYQLLNRAGSLRYAEEQQRDAS